MKPASLNERGSIRGWLEPDENRVHLETILRKAPSAVLEGELTLRVHEDLAETTDTAKREQRVTELVQAHLPGHYQALCRPIRYPYWPPHHQAHRESELESSTRRPRRVLDRTARTPKPNTSRVARYCSRPFSRLPRALPGSMAHTLSPSTVLDLARAPDAR